MISFEVNQQKFNYRAAAVIIYDGHVLLHRAIKDDFWALPGGRVEFFESSDATITREMQEELAVEAKTIRLLWHVESFFRYEEQTYHEIGNYFLSKFREIPTIESEIDFAGIETEIDLVFRWVPLTALSDYQIKPAFLAQGLLQLPATTEHLRISDLKEEA